MSEQTDVLDRGGFVAQVLSVIKVVAENKKYCSFAIDGKWGVGKSFIVEILNERLTDEKYTVLNYNCWESSYYNDPILAILVSVLNCLYDSDYIAKGAEDYKKTVNKLWIALNGVIQHFTGVDIKNAYNSNEVDESQSISKQIATLRNIISKNTSNNPVVIIIDEIDRCLPEYAIKVLERIYLMFNGIENIVVITVMDKCQLEHSVEQIFGESIPLDDYLRKFISFTIPLGNGEFDYSIYDKYNYYFKNYDINDDEMVYISAIFTSLIKDVDVRTLETILYRNIIIHNLLKNKNGNATLMCAELIIGTVYYIYNTIEKSIFQPYLTKVKRSDKYHGMIIINYLLDNVENNPVVDTDTKHKGKTLLNDSFAEMVLWLCSCVTDANAQINDGLWYILNKPSVSIDANVLLIKEFYKLLQYIR